MKKSFKKKPREPTHAFHLIESTVISSIFQCTICYLLPFKLHIISINSVYLLELKNTNEFIESIQLSSLHFHHTKSIKYHHISQLDINHSN